MEYKIDKQARGVRIIGGDEAKLRRQLLNGVITPRPAQQVALGEASCFNVRNNQVNDWMTQTPQAKTTVQPL